MSSPTSTPPGPATSAALQVGSLWTVRLWGLRSPRADALATALTVAVLATSRFALLPSGPWDWDETLFARGILKFDLPGHYPHPPGFPLWMLLGWLANFFVSEPLRGLQLLSATFSCLTLWPLAALGRRVAPPPVAAAAALLVLFLPGVWLHAGRGFSSTPASFFALWAAVLALRPADRRPVTAFTGLVTAAFLIRPILLPSLGLLWLAGVWRVTPRRRLLPGVAGAAAAMVLAVAGMVLAQGSWHEFARPFLVHGRTHARNLLGNTGSFAQLGIVKGLGGPVLACLLTLLAVVGLRLWLRRVGPQVALAWVAVTGVGIGQLIWLQNRTFSRYAVPFQMAAGPLVAGAASLAPGATGAAVLLAATAAIAARGWPAVAEQHASMMPGWEALLFASQAATRNDCDLVVEPGLFPFLSYLAHREQAAGRGWTFQAFLAPSSPEARDLPPRRYLLVTDQPRQYLPTPWERRWVWSGVSRQLRPLTSGRFLDAAVVEGAMVPVTGWWPAEGSGSEAFMWVGPLAEVLLPPLALEAPLALDLLVARGEAPLAVLVNGVDVATIPGDAPRLPVPLHPALFSPTNTNRLALRRARGYPPGGGDFRPLSARIFGFTSLAGDLATQAKERLAAMLAAADPGHHAAFPVSGLYPAENFPRGRGAWTKPNATMDLPLASGMLTFTLWAPRPGPVDLHITIDGEAVAGPLRVGQEPGLFSLVLTGRTGPATPARVQLLSRPYTPARHGGSDPRELGVVVSRVEFAPLTSARGQGWLAIPDRSGSWLLWTGLATSAAASAPTAAGWTTHAGEGETYLLAGEGAVLPLPTFGADQRLQLEVSVPPSTAAVRLDIDAQPVAVLLPGTPRTVLEVAAPDPAGVGPPVLTVGRARAGAGEVTVHLYRVGVRAVTGPWAGAAAHPLDRARLGVRLEAPVTHTVPLPATGLHGVESFPAGQGAWTFPEAELVLPAAAGILGLRLASPRPTPPALELFLDGVAVAGPLPLTPHPRELLVTLPPTARATPSLRLTLRARAFSPATRGSADSRELGVILLRGEFHGSGGSPLAHWTISPPASGSTWTLTAHPPGAYHPENFAGVEGCWLVPEARLVVPPGDGTLVITAWAPRPLPTQLEIRRDGVLLAGPIDLPNHPTQLEIPLRGGPSGAAETVLQLRAAPYSPHRHHGSNDRRELGIVLGHLAFRSAS